MTAIVRLGTGGVEATLDIEGNWRSDVPGVAARLQRAANFTHIDPSPADKMAVNQLADYAAELTGGFVVRYHRESKPERGEVV